MGKETDAKIALRMHVTAVIPKYPSIESNWKEDSQSDRKRKEAGKVKRWATIGGQ